MGNSCCISPFPGVIPGLVPAGTRQPQLFPSTSKHPNPSYRFLPIPATFSDHQDQSSSRMLWPNCGRGGGRSQSDPFEDGVLPQPLPAWGKWQPADVCWQRDGWAPISRQGCAPQKCNYGQASIERVCGELGTFLPRRTQTWENSFQSSPQSAGKPAFF